MKKSVAIIGGGTAGLFLAAFLDTGIFDVTIYEKNGTLGRKFLVAGDGGFNLTHSEPLSDFKLKYTPPSFLENALTHFSNADLRAWLNNLGIPTFVGSSGRVFPEKGIKPIKVLKSIEAYLLAKGVTFQYNKTFTGWNEENLPQLNYSEAVHADFTVFALGGSSWKVTGSDGSWLHTFDKKGIATIPFKSANCAFKVDWNEQFLENNEGKPLKNISISLNGKTQKGEAVITKFGIEGNAIYGLSPQIQTALSIENEVTVQVDFKPTNSLANLIEKLTNSELNTTDTLRRKIKLPSAVISLLKSRLAKAEFLDMLTLANYIKSFPMKIIGSAELDEAISTSGGVNLTAVNLHFELNQLKNHFCIGEMLDWNAPTGGYLIQGCASSGVYLADQLNNKCP